MFSDVESNIQYLPSCESGCQVTCDIFAQFAVHSVQYTPIFEMYQ